MPFPKLDLYKTVQYNVILADKNIFRVITIYGLNILKFQGSAPNKHCHSNPNML